MSVKLTWNLNGKTKTVSNSSMMANWQHVATIDQSNPIGVINKTIASELGHLNCSCPSKCYSVSIPNHRCSANEEKKPNLLTKLAILFQGKCQEKHRFKSGSSLTPERERKQLQLIGSSPERGDAATEHRCSRSWPQLFSPVI
jgi:hypothetical protein